jgi:peptidyl-tRNA hydrolase, PTH1 family
MDGWLKKHLGKLTQREAAPAPTLAPVLPQGNSWLLVPLGNPGAEYADTRHNMGRLLVQRWMDKHCLKPGVIHAFMALVPATYMNLSGQVCGEAAKAGFEAKRMILLHDDKDLPLGVGRFRMSGSDGGHNGLKSVFEHLGSAEIPRLRLGIGPFTRPLHEFVLGPWTDEEIQRIEAMDAPFARFMEALAGIEDLGELPGKVNAESFWMP